MGSLDQCLRLLARDFFRLVRTAPGFWWRTLGPVRRGRLFPPAFFGWVSAALLKLAEPAVARTQKDFREAKATLGEFFGIAVVDQLDPFFAQFSGKELPRFVRKLAGINEPVRSLLPRIGPLVTPHAATAGWRAFVALPTVSPTIAW
jgi:hypothetical protein